MDQEEKPNINPETPEEGAYSEEPATQQFQEEPSSAGEIIEQRDVKKLAAPGRLQRFQDWYKTHKKMSLPLTFLVLLAVLWAWPTSRYGLAGQVVKKDLPITVKDSLSGSPVSGAQISLGSQQVLTDAEGKAILKTVKAGNKTLKVSKKYYKDQQLNLTVPILKNQTNIGVSLVATGRQVKFKISNYVDGSPLGDVAISVAGTSAKTDDKGEATVVVPAGSDSQKATLSLDGFNKSEVTVKVSPDSIVTNDYKLTPSGHVYFFSKRTGKLDLMKANLDGTDIQTVLPGSGYEQTYTSSIMQSPNWKYVALVVKRSANDPTPQLYVLNTDDDKLISVENANAGFSLHGWSGNRLIYTMTRNDLPDWQTGKSKLKSYNASTGKVIQLDQTSGVSDTDGTGNESYSVVMVSGSTVLYGKGWYMNGSKQKVQDSLHSINADGQSHRVVTSYDFNGAGVQYSQHTPTSLYIWRQQLDGNGNFYDYSVGSAQPKEIQITADDFYNGQGYMPSPSGQRVLWTEQRDGKNAIITADSDGSNQQVIGSFSDYYPYGWFSDDYVLLSKNNNELYVMSSKGGTPHKITDYQYTSYYY